MSGGAATILHADLDSFFASVEQRDDPALRGRPVIVGGGVVLAASYEAKAFGVRSAMGGREARARCPDAVVVPARPDAYTEASRNVFAVFEDTTPLVEALSIDEAFLEVGGLRRLAGTPIEIAARLRRDVRERVGLPITVGIARTKYLAKVASRVAKPDGLLLVPPDGEDDFLLPLPVGALWGVGPKTTEKLAGRGIATVADVAALPETALVAILGPASGHHLHSLAHHRDPRVVRRAPRRKSMGAQHAIGWGPKTPESVDATLAGLVDRVMRRLRAAERVGRTITLRLRFEDFTKITRSHTLDQATAHTDTVLAVARDLLGAAAPLIEANGVTLVGVTVSQLGDDAAIQLALPFTRRSDERLDTALDRVLDRFGSGAVTRALLLGRDPGIRVPMLPD